MKRVSVITILDNNNYGTFLQAFALCKVLETYGWVPELVDYCRPHAKPLTSWLQMCKEVKNPLRIISRTRGYIRSTALHRKDRLFVKPYLSPRICYSVEDIRNSITVADVYMTGSDQVWNSIHNRGIDKAFFLAYAPEGAKKISYAASVGMPEFKEWEKNETKSLLEQYCHITLREESAINLLGSLGLDTSKLKSVLDPTLLLDKNQWEKYINRPRLHEEKYLLVYSVETKAQDALINSVAEKVAKDNGLKIVGVYYGGKYNRIMCCDYNHFYATPDEFLSLIYYADFTVVSSFHGTAFSITFEKDFFTIMPDRFNSRVNNLLQISGLENRMIKSSNIEKLPDYTIDYSNVREKIKVEREQSTVVLNEMLEN